MINNPVASTEQPSRSNSIILLVDIPLHIVEKMVGPVWTMH